VEQLAQCGARVDNLVFAAAVGDVTRVKGMLGEGRRPAKATARSAQRIGVRGPALDPRHMLEYALIYAAGLGRREVVELLLSKGPDLGVRDPVYGGTAAGIAAYRHPSAGRPNGSPEIVELFRRAQK